MESMFACIYQNGREALGVATRVKEQGVVYLCMFDYVSESCDLKMNIDGLECVCSWRRKDPGSEKGHKDCRAVEQQE